MKQLFLSVSTFICSALAAQVNADDYYYASDLNTNTNEQPKAIYTASQRNEATAKASTTIKAEPLTSTNLQYTKVINNIPEWAMKECGEMAEKRRNYIVDIYNRGKSYFPKVNKIFAKYNIPSELNVILAIESYFQKDIVSHSGAVGYWQFMDATAVEYGLSIDSTNDERKDFNKSTVAAAKYLRNHYKMFNDWYLTVASYNCGGGTVRRAMAKSGIENPNFFDIKHLLPKETQNYVMKYITLNLAYKNYTLYLQNKLQWTDEKKQQYATNSYTASSKASNSLNLE